MLAQTQPLGEKEEVEPAAFGGLCEPPERLERDLTAGLRIAPHGGVVDTREVRTEPDLLVLLGHCLSFQAAA